jgi:hypothetical protein
VVVVPISVTSMHRQLKLNLPKSDHPVWETQYSGFS